MRFALAALLILSACGDNAGNVNPPTSYDLGSGDGLAINDPDGGGDATADIFLLIDAPQMPIDSGNLPPDAILPPLDMPMPIVDTLPPIVDAAPTVFDATSDAGFHWPFDFKITLPDGLFIKKDQGTVTVDSGLPTLSDFGIIIPKFCTSNSSCNKTEYCSRSSCTSMVLGTCATKPTDCSTETVADTQCGCDGVTYYNSCYRRQAGTNKSAAAECDSTDTNTQKCGGATLPYLTCPSQTHTCVKAAASATNCTITSAFGTGKCWALPDTCPTNVLVFVKNYRACGDDTTCLSICAARKSGTYYPKQCITLP